MRKYSIKFAKIQNNLEVMWQEKGLGPSAWNNNNCESVNHMLKLAVDWKPQRVSVLVNLLRSVVHTQYTDIRRALCGQGEFQLTKEFAGHTVPYSRWVTMSDARQNELFETFMSDTGVKPKSKTITSSDGLLTVKANNRVARKPGQTRQPKACRTQSNVF